MFRKPLFWILFILFSLVCAAFTYHYFPRAFPVVSVDITMDRQMALNRASALSETFNWGPDGYHRAASYNLDNQVKNYTELETGGADAFREMLEAGLYSPYTWQVRHFREQDVNETLIRFTPGGEPYGFRKTLSENVSGPVLTADSARSIAETEAEAFWETDMQAFVPVESSENLRPAGRLDHTFVYEREIEKIGEATYRLRLVISGDKLTELTHFVWIPEAFDRQFEEMRSANNTLANGASIAMIILFLMGGCGFGLFYLIMQRFIIWKQPVVWGTVIALLVTFSIFNSWPLQWMSYDTALSFQNHIIEQVVTALLAFIGMALVFSIIFMTAESLTRKAFPNHIQFWKLWSPGVASTRQVLGMTLAAFLLVGYELSYVTGTYYLTSHLLGWWYPSSALFNPNIIAEYFPWFTAFAISLQAAFWEEALFRAIPIAGAVLLGQRFGKTTLWVIAAIVLQAVIFGAAHADYPQQPFYARTAELIIPSIIFGLIYYFIGLYAAILIHFWYNFVWFSIPIFSTATPGIIVDQVILIMIGLLPFWVILFQFFRTRSMGEIPEDVLNGSWIPITGVVKTAREPVMNSDGSPLLSPFAQKAVIITGVAGLVVWLMLTDFRKNASPVEMSRTEAIEFAKQEISIRGFEIDLSKNWKVFSRVYGGINLQHRFIWQEGGEEAYRDLLGSYLVPPVWHVRLALFEGELEEKAEEFHVYIAGRDSIEAFRHILPESRPGARPEEAEARRFAEQTITDIHRARVSGYVCRCIAVDGIKHVQ